MIYLILNIAVTVFLGFFTHLIDHKVKSDNVGVSSFAIAMLLTTIEAGIFSLILFLRNFWFDAMTVATMKILFCIESFFFTTLSFGLISLGMRKKRTIITLIKFALFILGIVLVFTKFTTIEVSNESGVVIVSEYLFADPARKFFPWTWVTVYNAIYKYIVPAICFIFLLVFQENRATQIERYQSILIGEGFVLMWAINAIINFISASAPAFSLLFIYAYLFLYVVIYMSLTRTAVPSGKAMFVTIIKTLISYLLPAGVIGAVCYFTLPKDGVMSIQFIVLFCVAAIVSVLFALWISSLLSTSTKLYTADYEAALEKDLARIEYKDVEMDQVTTRMYEIFRKNVEASSVNVYILSGQNEFDVAYSSNQMENKISLNNPIFDNLLNIGRSIVVQSQLEKEHDLSVVEEGMKKFFKETRSDALFILNEGHNIFGLITLGKKVSGDHYKEYDYNVFVKLYSYFFVFGYYMRNIANKDIMGIVNREIRMSSQIITSIQENLDHIKNPKVDIGYMMVPAHNIGGEFIDMIRLTATRHLFVVGDLSGKGIAASMNMVILKSIIRTYLAEVHDFKQLVVKLNTFIRDSLQKGTIFAGLFALVDFETDTMYYINCGIPTLMMYTQVYNNVIEIQGSGHILGFVKDISPYVSVKTTKLNPGDIILACTDGLIQSHSLRGEQFGKERVQQAVLDNSTYPAQRMAQFTFDNLVKFMSKEMEDDVSILVIKYESLETEKQETETNEENSTAQEEVTENEVADSENPSEGESPIEEAPAPVDSQMDLPTDAVDGIESAKEEAQVEAQTAEKASPVEKTEEVQEEKKPIDDMGLPEGFEMPDLSDLDAMMKEAGL
ncbi:MAG: SpoIIE family protein phosphatase [Treponema sp.]|nr:SpoIIE family protein phosphatase [Treponema sp.]